MKDTENTRPNAPTSALPNSTFCNVPRLRFPGFEGEWERVKVTDLLEFFPTNSLSWEQLEYNGVGTLNLHYGLIHNGLPTQVNLKECCLPSNKNEYNLRNCQFCKDGDVAFADASEDTNDVGKVVEFIDCNGRNVVCGLHTIHGRDRMGKTVLGFKGYAFSSQAFHNQIRRICQGTKVFSISTRSFQEVQIGIPKKSEQKKISSLLSLIDQRISIQNKTIEDLKKLKSALCRMIFEQPPLNFITLSDLIVKGKAGGTPRSTNKDYYNGNIPFLSINDISKQGKYITSTDNSISEKGLRESSAWLVPAGSLILSMYASVGLPTINKLALATSQAMFSMILKQPELIDYLYYYLCYFKDRFIYQYLETGTQSNINSEIVKSLKIPDYGIANIKFGRILSVVDERIKNEEQVVAKLQCQKSYLLRSLFV